MCIQIDRLNVYLISAGIPQVPHWHVSNYGMQNMSQSLFKIYLFIFSDTALHLILRWLL